MSAFGPYVLLRKLATGGMADLWLARARVTGGIERFVVIKRLHPDKADDEEFQTMLGDEARILGRLTHPHIAGLVDAGEIGREPYLAQEFVRGTTLRELMDAVAPHRLPDAIALRVLLDVALALEYVHGARDEYSRPMRVVHRDLTPKNILVGHDGVTKVIDFGIAQGENRVYQTSTGTLKGTCGYMAPEQLTERGEIDMRADVFSFGVVAYEVLTGAHPFVAASALDLYREVLSARHALARQVRPDLTPALASLIEECLERMPDRRPPHMGYVAAALRNELLRHGQFPLWSEIGRAISSLRTPNDDDPATEPNARTGGVTTEVERGR
jgi:serine/threonine protein kinase